MQRRERLFFGGTIYTMDETRPIVSAVAVKNGIIAAVGDVSACRAALGPGFEPFDLKGATLLPGFCDCHVHPLSTVFYTMNANLLGVRNTDELVGRLIASGREKNGWVIGCNFDEQGMDDPRMPIRFDLDRVSTTRPVIVLRHDGHSVLANSAAITAAGITATTAAPEGGLIDRDEHGEPLGIFREHAAPLILDHMPLPGMEELTAGVQKTFGIMLGYGITSLGAILQTGPDGPGGQIGAYDVPLIEMMRPHIPQALYLLLMAGDVDAIAKVKSSALHEDGHSARTRVGGMKIIADGTFGSSTAAMEQPFLDQPDNYGFMLYEEETLYARMLNTHRAGHQLAIHAIGDRANRLCIELYARMLREHPRPDHRHRIEHASMLDAAMLRQAKALGLVLSMQPMFVHSDMPFLERRIGTARMEYTYPLRAVLEAGIPLAGSSDSPVETQQVLAAVECAVTREGYVPGQAISVMQALAMYTKYAAYAQFEEDQRGTITPGKHADFAILSADPLSVNPEEIHAIEVQAACIDGDVAYTR